MNIRRHEAWKRLNGGPKGTEILRIASPEREYKEAWVLERLNGGPKGTEILRIASPSLDLRRPGNS